jgi:hypothetical protein
MNGEHREIEEGLAALTRWSGPEPGLWKRALADEGGRNQAFGTVWELLRIRISRAWLSAAAVALVGVVVTTAVISELEGVGSAAKYVPAEEATRGYVRNLFGREVGDSTPALREPAPAPGLDTLVDRERAPSMQIARADAADAALAPAERQVVRKATIELVTPDVRAVFLKATHLVSEASGEYVQESSVTGDGEEAAANVTLRVVASRLSAVLAGLRDLGEVHSENSVGEDVTEQMVDLEARLRNEQRVEAELLALLESRQDAPLKEILELRQTISSVRESIERLTAQRDRLSRLVSLASVLVIIRADADGIAPGSKGSLMGYFGGAMGDSWRGGLRALSDTLAWIVRVLVGGAVWWALAAAVVLVVRTRTRIAKRPGTVGTRAA